MLVKLNVQLSTVGARTFAAAVPRIWTVWNSLRVPDDVVCADCRVTVVSPPVAGHLEHCSSNRHFPEIMFWLLCFPYPSEPRDSICCLGHSKNRSSAWMKNCIKHSPSWTSRAAKLTWDFWEFWELMKEKWYVVDWRFWAKIILSGPKWIISI